MSKSSELTDWRIENKPPVMTRKFLFDSYEETRAFVNALADLSESTGYYPNMTYSQTQATITIYADADENNLSESEFDFALATDEIAAQYIQKTEE